MEYLKERDLLLLLFVTSVVVASMVSTNGVYLITFLLGMLTGLLVMYFDIHQQLPLYRKS